MKSKEFIKLFISLSLGVLFVFSFSHFGAIAYERLTKQSDIFEEGTIIGSFDVSNLTKEQAKEFITASINTWFETCQLTLYYKDVELKINSELFRFSLSESVEAATNGQVSPLLISIQEPEYKEIIAAFNDPTLYDVVNHEKLMKEILNVVTTFKKGKFSFKVLDFLEQNLDPIIISTGDMKLTKEQVILIEEAIAGRKQFVISAKSEFSLLKFMNEHSIKLSNEHLSFIASTLYKTILPTNFEIVERHTSRQLPDYNELGYEAKVVAGSMDFSVYNPNSTDYVVNIKFDTPLLTMDLIGAPLLYKYEIVLKDKQIFPPKSIIRFNSKLPLGETKMIEEGKAGYLVTVIRNQLEKNGKILDEEILSEDFYPPIHRVVARSRISAETPNVEPPIEDSPFKVSERDE